MGSGTLHCQETELFIIHMF